MVCRPFKIGNAHGFVCSRGERAPRCSQCGKPAEKLCDFPIIGKGVRTCDKKLCDACATEIEAERLSIQDLAFTEKKEPDTIDVCPAHLRFIEKKEKGDQ